MSINRKATSLAIASAIAVGAFVPAVALAKTYKVNMTQGKATITGINLKGTVTGKPFGKCKSKGKVTPPKVTIKWTCKGGTVTTKSNDSTIKGANFVSTGKMSGTGKYKKLKGKTKSVGPITGDSVKITGTVTF